MKQYFSNYKDKEFLLSFFTAILFFAVSLVINFYAGMYATKSASSPVTDIILSNIRVFDVGYIFTYGAMLFWVFAFLLGLYHPKKFPYALKTIALFTIIRAIFISLTHIGPFPTQLIVENGTILSKFTFGGDLFFSGHTGLPFLVALMFWDKKVLRWIFIVCSLIFGVIVLLGHIHYSIDVLAAFFITYTIFHISLYLFKKDRKMFLG
jgi:membrane-associated phospholipid phosphatase